MPLVVILTEVELVHFQTLTSQLPKYVIIIVINDVFDYGACYIPSATYQRPMPIPIIAYHLTFFLFVKIFGEPKFSSPYEQAVILN